MVGIAGYPPPIMRRLGCLGLAIAALALPASAGAQDCIGRSGCPYTSAASIPLPVTAYGIATDSSANLYLTNPGAGQVYRFSPTGTLDGNWFSSTGTSALYGVAVSPDGSEIFAVDNAGDQVLAFDGANPNSSETAKLAAGDLEQPLGLALDATVLNIGDTGNRRVLQLTTQGTTLGQAVTLTPPDWTAVDPQGDIWAVGQPAAANADEDSPAIQEFSSTLGQLSQAIVPLAASPGGAAIDSAGDLFISDTANDLVLQYSAGGTLVDYFGGNGGALGEFSGPLGLAVDDSDNLHVVDPGNQRVERFALGPVAQAMATRSAAVAGGRAPITVQCLARGIPSCDGTLTLQSGGRTAGASSFTVVDDASERVKVKLKPRARRQLRRHETLKVNAYARTDSRPDEPDRVTASVQRLRARHR